jgi:hypothetical protein
MGGLSHTEEAKMDKLLRLSDYDIFAYLVPGLVVLGMWDIVFGTNLVTDAEWTVAHTGFVIVLGYVIGHVVAAVSTPVLDRFIVRGLVGPPMKLLMQRTRDARLSIWRRWLFGGYMDPLPASVQDRVIQRAGLSAHDVVTDLEASEALFFQAWPVIKREPIPYSRMDSFLRLYGFCRSLSVVSLLCALGLFYVWVQHPAGAKVTTGLGWWIVLAFILSITMFKRYLRFFRSYGVEVLSTFAESSSK